jgi:hypothetical protein
MLGPDVVCVDIGSRAMLEPKVSRLWRAGFPSEVREPVPGFVALYIDARHANLYCARRPEAPLKPLCPVVPERGRNRG